MEPISKVTSNSSLSTVSGITGQCNCPACKAARAQASVQPAAGVGANSLEETPDATPDSSQSDSTQISQFKSIDSKTRAHEQAHLNAAGSYATGMPVYNMQRGPDGQMYANGGHVNVDLTPIAGNPQATLQKAQTIKKSALAPDDPSSQDMSVASKADQMMQKAQSQMAQKNPHAGSLVNVVA